MSIVRKIIIIIIIVALVAAAAVLVPGYYGFVPLYLSYHGVE